MFKPDRLLQVTLLIREVLPGDDQVSKTAQFIPCSFYVCDLFDRQKIRLMHSMLHSSNRCVSLVQ